MIFCQELSAEKVKKRIALIRNNKIRYKKSKNNQAKGGFFFFGIWSLTLSFVFFWLYLNIYNTFQINFMMKLIFFMAALGIFLIICGLFYKFFKETQVRSELERFTYSGELHLIFANIEHPAVVARKEDLFFEYNKFKYFKGSTILEIAFEMRCMDRKHYNRNKSLL